MIIRQRKDIAIVMFKAKNNLLPRYLQDLFNLQEKGEKQYKLINSDVIMPCFNTIKYGKHSVSYLGPFLWSKLSKKERDMNSLNAFKCSISKRDLSEVMEDGGCKGCYLCNSIQLSPEGKVNSGLGRDAKRRGIYLALFTDPEGDSCFSIYQISWIKMQKCNFWKLKRHSIGPLFTIYKHFGDFVEWIFTILLQIQHDNHFLPTSQH